MRIERALVSVSDKSGLMDLAFALRERGVEIVSTGGSRARLEEGGFSVTPVEEVTGNPEAFRGRMKTLSFQIGGALLYDRDHEEDVRQAAELGIRPVDLVVCNLYPFEKMASSVADVRDLIEYVDIGGPTMLRAGAKNYRHVCVLCDPSQYADFIREFRRGGETRIETRQALALEAFRHTARYEAAIAGELGFRFDDSVPAPLPPFREARALRYGENPHQSGWALSFGGGGLADALSVRGKELSYNNYLDMDAAFACCADLKGDALEFQAVVVKHGNPCCAAVSKRSALHALETAWRGDPVSAYGGVVCLGSPVDGEAADFLASKFVEVLAAPSYSDEALSLLEKRKGLRVLELQPVRREGLLYRSIDGGMLAQTRDLEADGEFSVVTEADELTGREGLLRFATIVCKHLKSNAVCLCGEETDALFLAGAGMGNPNRLLSLVEACEKAGENGFSCGELVLASDAFLPFVDNVEEAARRGVRGIVQPGGSRRDRDVIGACNRLGVSMAFTSRRHFSH